MRVTISVQGGKLNEENELLNKLQDYLAALYSVLNGDSEKNFGVAGCSVKAEYHLGAAKPHVDTAELLDGLPHGKGYWQGRLSAGAVSAEALQGITTGYAIDPLEAAIDQAVRLLRDERESEAGQKGIKTVACQRLESHLNELLALQLKQLSEPNKDEALGAYINEMTRKLQVLIDTDKLIRSSGVVA